MAEIIVFPYKSLKKDVFAVGKSFAGDMMSL